MVSPGPQGCHRAEDRLVRTKKCQHASLEHLCSDLCHNLHDNMCRSNHKPGPKHGP